METILTTKKERLKLTPEQLLNVYLECTAPGAPVKTILERYGLKPWDLVALRKKVRAGAIEALANAKPGRKKHVVAVEQFQPAGDRGRMFGRSLISTAIGSLNSCWRRPVGYGPRTR